MPAVPSPRQPAADARDWFLTPAGRAVLASEDAMVAQALCDRPGLPWLWCGPDPGEDVTEGATGRGLCLSPAGEGWHGAVERALPLPLPSESFGAVVLQHVARPGIIEAAGELRGPLAAEGRDTLHEIVGGRTGRRYRRDGRSGR